MFVVNVMLIAILIAILSNYFFPLNFSQKLNKVRHVEFIELILKKYNVDIVYYKEWKISKMKNKQNKKIKEWKEDLFIVL